MSLVDIRMHRPKQNAPQHGKNGDRFLCTFSFTAHICLCKATQHGVRAPGTMRQFRVVIMVGRSRSWTDRQAPARLWAAYVTKMDMRCDARAIPRVQQR